MLKLWSAAAAPAGAEPAPAAKPKPDTEAVPGVSGTVAVPQTWEGLKFHQPPKPLPPGARTEDWPRFLGPEDRPVSRETGILQEFPGPEGPAKVWECRKGTGYTSPAIADGRLVLFHRMDGAERLDCLDPETGKRFWTCSWPVEYRDDFGFNDGPRAGPVISGGQVYAFGVTSQLRCVDLISGKVRWQVDLQEKYQVPKYFFGSGASPLVTAAGGGLVVVNAGGGDGQCLIAFDRETGAERWITRHPWGQSYASPIAASWHGQNRLLVFAGGKSEPATGGLVVADPVTGALEDTFPWRARRYPSVNAATPVLCGPDQVFISQAYVDRGHPHNGGVLLRTDANGRLSPVWTDASLGCHWMTPVFHDGHLYAFSGEKDRACELVCHETATGRRLWREKMSWEHTTPDGRTLPMGLYRGSLLRVQGKFLCLGEWGTLCWLDLSPAGATRLATAQLFTALESWTLPALSHGLLYVMQNEPDRLTGEPSRLICYDLRKSPGAPPAGGSPPAAAPDSGDGTHGEKP